MILHLFPAEKFTTDYINRIQRLFSEEKHVFIVYGEQKKEYRLYEISNREDVILTSKIYLLKDRFRKLVYSSKKVICHSLFLKLVDLTYLNAVIKNNRVSLLWVIWGKDLYEDYEKSRSLKSIITVKPVIKEVIRRSLIKKTDIFITTGDYDVLKERYKLKSGSKAMGAQYSYNLLRLINCPKNKKVKVMVGHSATDTCRHIETFNMLKTYTGKIQVYCPLSYPNNHDYISMVSSDGKRLFGDDFFPLTEFIKYDEYVAFLNTIDIGVFNNSRQQGMGNITNLLYLGKKVYLSQDNTIAKSYHRPEYCIFDYKDIQRDNFLQLLSKEEAEINRNRIIFKFSDKNFYDEWRRIFDE